MGKEYDSYESTKSSLPKTSEEYRPWSKSIEIHSFSVIGPLLMD